MNKDWYTVTLIMRSKDKSQDSTIHIEEQVWLVYALDADEAYAEAIALGRAEEERYKNVNDTHVVWEFMGIQDIDFLDVDALEHGTELRSRFLKESDSLNVVCPKEKLQIFLGNN